MNTTTSRAFVRTHSDGFAVRSTQSKPRSQKATPPTRDEELIDLLGSAVARRLAARFGDAAGQFEDLVDTAAAMVKLDWDNGQRCPGQLAVNAHRELVEEIAEIIADDLAVEAEAVMMFPA